MIEDDTIKLLRECNAGIKMGVSSIDEVLPHVTSKELDTMLSVCKERHEQLGNETHALLNEYGDAGKEPNPIAKGMSWMRTNVMITVDKEDATIADLMVDGCNMGVKSLSKYLNEYAAAEERVKDIAKRLITLEENLSHDIRAYL